MIYLIWQQLIPVNGIAQFLFCGELERNTAKEAINEAKKLSIFKEAKGLGKFPCVSEKPIAGDNHEQA